MKALLVAILFTLLFGLIGWIVLGAILLQALPWIIAGGIAIAIAKNARPLRWSDAPEVEPKDREQN